MAKIHPQNISAQLHYRAHGNPPNTLPASAISNCFPGLEFDFRAVWRRMFVGIVLSENNNYVVAAEDNAFQDLVGHRLVLIDGQPTGVATSGVVNPSFPAGSLGTSQNPNGVSFMEWSNSLARIMAKQGQKVRCSFTAERSDVEVLPDKSAKYTIRELELRRFFEPSSLDPAAPLAVIARALAQPGELTQGLCSPWQNDYRECACYYWAASRPDYVNVVDAADGETRGDNWLAKEATGHYVLDDRADSRLVTYDDLFADWQRALHFVIGGSDEADRNDPERSKA
jgi:hypothetical protein